MIDIYGRFGFLSITFEWVVWWRNDFTGAPSCTFQLISSKIREIIKLPIVVNTQFFVFFTLAILCPWLDFGLSPRFPQVLRCHWGEIGPFSATLAQDGLMKCDQPGKIPWNTPPATVGYWTRVTGRTDSEMHSFSHCAIMTRARERTDSEIHFITNSLSNALWLVDVIDV